MVTKEENPVAVGYVGRCTRRNSLGCRNHRARHDHRYGSRFSFWCLCYIRQILGIPVWVGRKLYARYKNDNKHKRNAAIVGGVVASVSFIILHIRDISRVFFCGICIGQSVIHTITPCL